MNHKGTITYARKAADQYEMVMPLTAQNDKRLRAIRQAAKNTEILQRLEKVEGISITERLKGEQRDEH